MVRFTRKLSEQVYRVPKQLPLVPTRIPYNPLLLVPQDWIFLKYAWRIMAKPYQRSGCY